MGLLSYLIVQHTLKMEFEMFLHFVHHGNCTYYLKKNLNANFPRNDLTNLFRTTSEAYTITKFESNLIACVVKRIALMSTYSKKISIIGLEHILLEHATIS